MSANATLAKDICPRYIVPDWVWQLRFEPFVKRGDIIILASPGCIHIYVANAEVIHQITAKREAFPKPLETYRILDIFGRNVITTEGSEWKQHRKVLSPSFNEKNNALVFAEACKQAQGMLRKWTTISGNPTIEEIPKDVMRLTLYIISRVGFGVRLLWPGEKLAQETAPDGVFNSNEPPEGHSMSFETSLDTLLSNLIWVILTPMWLMSKSYSNSRKKELIQAEHLPFGSARKAYDSFINWGQYMNELFAQKVEEAHQGDHDDGMDIMGSLVRSSYGKNLGATKSSLAQVEKGEHKIRPLSDSDILGNAFVMIVAGHETTANSKQHFPGILEGSSMRVESPGASL
jgi:cytochrome P450